MACDNRKSTATELQFDAADPPQISPSCCNADSVRLIKPSEYRPRGTMVDVPGSNPPLKAYLTTPADGVKDKSRAVLHCYDVIGQGGPHLDVNIRRVF